MRIIYAALFMGAGTFLVFQWAYSTRSLSEARTIAFCTMVTYQWFAAFYARSDETPLSRLGVFRNRYLIFAIIIAILLQLAIVYIPAFEPAFGTYPLTLADWGIVIAASFSLFLVEELRKLFFPAIQSRQMEKRVIAIRKSMISFSIVKGYRTDKSLEAVSKTKSSFIHLHR